MQAGGNMARIQLWVDVDALNAAIFNAPLTSETAFPILEAVGLPISQLSPEDRQEVASGAQQDRAQLPQDDYLWRSC
jgi:hypothetical protein